MAVNVTISSTTGSFQGGTYILGPANINSAFTSLAVVSLTFNSATFISTTAPLGAYGCLIEPPAANNIQLTLKGITGDTGIPIGANLPCVIPFFNPTLSTNVIGLTSAAAITGVVTLTFF